MEWTIGSVLKQGLDIWKKHWFLLAAVALFSIVLPMIPHWLQSLVSEEALLIRFWLFVIGFLFHVLVSMGLNTISLKAAKGEEYVFSDFFSRYHLFPSYFCAMVLSALAVALGFLLLVIPGIILALKFSLSSFFVLDQGCKGIEALKKSNLATYGSKWRLLGLGLAGILINMLGLALLGIGYLVTLPILTITWATVYFNLRGVQ